MHRFILDAPRGSLEVDHIDGNRLNNIRDNLRLVTHAQNCQNHNKIRSKSGIRGVYWDKTKEKWYGQIELGGMVHHIGYFNDLKQASLIMREARSRLMPYSNN